MSLKEALWGTPREIQADKRYGDLSRISQRRKLNPTQEAELVETKGLSRRLFLRRGVTVLGGVATASSPAGAYLLTHPEIFQSGENRFFGEIAELPLDEQISRIDSYYSTNKLSVETARARVVPIWVKNYLAKSGSDLTLEQVLPNFILFTNDNRTEEQAKITHGKVDTDARRNYKGPIQINFSTFDSNRVYPSDGNPPTSGIVLLRTEATHELTHYDVTFRSSSTMGGIINDHSVYVPPIEFPERILIDGFSFATIEPNETAHAFFFNFDEISTDVIMSYILDKGGHKSVFGYPKARVMKDFLDWIGLPRDKFIQYHRNSDLEGVAREIGQLSNTATQISQSTDSETTARELKVLKVFHNGNSDDLEAFFPGTTQKIFGAR